ncbi:MAG: type II secretion system F family protein [Verrucomicrobia bacterium]|nr:type II secretion system F family protein [Verrucomicrobiota bacterium]
MPSFTYSARTRAGQKVAGVVEANDRRGALVQIESLGHVPVAVSEKASAKGKAKESAQAQQARGKLTVRRGPARLNSREVLVFTAELSDLLASGMTLGNALNTLGNRRSGRPSDEIIKSLRDEIIRGASLSDAMMRHPASFSSLYVHMIRAGEASGALDEVLKRLNEHFERVQETKEKVVMALVYPVIVLVMGVATMIFSMVYVVPKFQTVFEQMGQALPLPTRMLIGMSVWLVKYGWAAAVVVVILCVLCGRALKTPRGRRVWDQFLLRLPLLRGVVAAGIYANFARTLSTLLANGVAVLQALGIVEKTVGNLVIGEEIRKARERVTDGTTISGPLSAGKIFPEMLTDMMAIGEQTGDMPGALNHIARRYENELNRHIKIFTTALEPILIVVVAVMVGFVAISILLAVFSLTNGLNI